LEGQFYVCSIQNVIKSSVSFVQNISGLGKSSASRGGDMIDEALNEMGLMRMQISESRGSSSQLVDNNNYY